MKKLSHYVLFTSTGTGLSVARKLQKEGVTVTVAMVQDLNEIVPPDSEPVNEDEMVKSRRLDVYRNMLDIHPANEVFEALMRLKDKEGYFIDCDTNDLCRYAELLEKSGFEGHFPHFDELEMESDRDKAKEFVKKHYKGYLEVASKPEFTSVDNAIKFLEENADDARWGLKGEEGVDTTIPKDKDFKLAKEHVLQALKDQKEKIDDKPFVLERIIDDPVEITPEIFFYNGKPVFYSIDIEMKRVGAGDYGPMSGCSSNLVFAVTPESEIIQMAFPPVVYEMAKKHKGWFLWDASILFDREGTPWFGEFCFDPETEVLTREGYKNYTELKVGQEVMSINPMTRQMEWKPITRVVVKRHDGEMVRMGGDGHSIDVMVTPDHKLLLGSKEGSFKRYRAGDLKHDSNLMLPRVGVWQGNTVPELRLEEIVVTVPERTVKKGAWSKGEGDRVMTPSGERNYATIEQKVSAFVRHTLPARTFSTVDFCFFLGFWLAEGSFGSYFKGEPRSIILAQSPKSKFRKEIETCLNKLDISYKVAKNGSYEIHNRRLAIYLWNELGLKGTHADTKFIPSFFKELNVECLKSLWHGFCVGDGSFNKNQWTASTVSKRLIDDWQEVLHKVGIVGNIVRKPTKGTTMTVNGKSYVRNYDIYSISERKEKVNWVMGRGVRKEKYSGTVWDISVTDNESLFVRRNGKAYFSSNCPNRKGWDSFQTECEMFGSVKEMIEALINGDDLYSLLKAHYGAAIRIHSLDKDDKERRVLRDAKVNWLPEIDDHVWPFDVMRDKEGDIVTVGADWGLAVVTGKGNSPEEAGIDAYRNLEGFGIENYLVRPKEDYLSTAYPTSIMNRFNWGSDWLWETHE